MAEAKISTKYQIVIPREARDAMAVGAGDKLIVETLRGVMVLIPRGKRMTTLLRGHSRGLFPKSYLRSERKSW